MATKKNAAHSGAAKEESATGIADKSERARSIAATARSTDKLCSQKAKSANSRGMPNIPKQMREAQRWITWRYLDNRKTGKRQKLPCPAKGWNSPDNWHTFGDAIAAMQAQPGLALGFVLGDGWTGLDVDGAWPEGAKSTAPDDMREHGRKAWDACKGAYVERSPSRTGFKAFVYFGEGGPTGQAVRHMPELGEHVGTECYAGGRWFALTGDVMPDCGRDVCNVAARRGFVDLLRELRGPAADRVRAIDDGAGGLADIGAVRPHTAKLEADLRAALSLLPADDRKTWVRYGIAIKGMAWDDDKAAFQLWHEWSATAWNYEGEAACRERWDEFEPRGEVSVASIFAAAKKAMGDAPASEDTLLAELSKPLPLDDYPMERFMSLDSAAPLQLLPNLLAPGLTLLQGRQKSGKTYMLLQLAVALATRGRFLGVRASRPYSVKCYLLEEAGDPTLQRARFHDMGFDDVFRDAPECMQNLHLSFGDLPAIDKGGLQQLVADLEAFDAVLVDSATALDYGKVGRGELDVFRRHYRELALLQRAARKSRKCLLLLAHTRKGSEVSKSSPDDIGDATGGKVAAIDAYWALQEDPKRGLWRLTVRGRNASTSPLALRHDREGDGHWHSLGPWDGVDAVLPDAAANESTDDDAPTTRDSTIAKDIVLVLDLLGPLETSDVVQYMQPRSESAVMGTLRTLARHKVVERLHVDGAHAGRVGRPGSVWRLL